MKLRNNGRRVIQHGKFNFHPGDVVDFPDELGAKIHKLFKREVESVDDATKPFVDDKSIQFPIHPEPAALAEKKLLTKKKSEEAEDFDDLPPL